jgi:uncharacterized protein YecE (DUF72 family)
MNPAGAIRIGTSGFSYKEWLGGFYPAKLAGTKMLTWYAERLPTVEINYTFRAMPRREMLEKWAVQTPRSFRFALKAPQRITHWARLRGVEDAVNHFIETSSALGERLGPVLFQLPPGFKRDLGVLADFLTLIRGRLRPAFEFRDNSWFDGSAIEILRDRGAALCISQSEKISSPIERTANFVYLRLRNETYDAKALRSWADRILGFADEGAEVFVYFKHETGAPDLAYALGETLQAGSPERG